MRSAAVIIALAALSATSAYQLDMTEYWGKLGQIKVMEHCLGSNPTNVHLGVLVNSLFECNDVTSAGDSGLAIESLDTANWNKLFNDYSPRFYTQKEFAPDNTQRIANVKKRIAHLIRRFRCVMQKKKMTTSNNQINRDGIVANYMSMGLSPSLQADLLTGVDQCYKLTQCFPLGQLDASPIPKDVVQVQTFLKCERYLRHWACLKNYVQGFLDADQFDFSGAEGTLDFLPDDQSRAAAVAFANELLSGDDYGLFE